MRLVVLAVGRLKAGPERELVERYALRIAPLGRTLGWHGPVVQEITEAPHRSAAERKRGEGQALLAALPPGAVAVALDEAGSPLSSSAFAELLRTRTAGATAAIAFIIGGPDGLDEALLERAQHRLSFGGMTLPHQLVRVLLLEQLYRAATILTHHPYHRA